MLVDGHINTADLTCLKLVFHRRYKTSADSSAAVFGMDGNAEITAVILLDRTNQRTNNLPFILGYNNEIRVP
ncbi:hypothetical protein D3C87_1886550 [compost metagenome]